MNKSLCLLLFIIAPYANALIPISPSTQQAIFKALLEEQESNYLHCLDRINHQRKSVNNDNVNRCKEIAEDIKTIKRKWLSMKGEKRNDK